MARRAIEPAKKPIKAVLAEFLADQCKRLRPTTFRRYDSIIQLFEASMDRYGPQYLDKDEESLWEKFFNASGFAHREFCELFGPEKIPQNIGEFLNYFMPAKVMCGEDLLRAAGTVTKKLSKWLAEKGYVDSGDAADMAESGASAARDLPAAEALEKLLAAHASASASTVNRRIEGYFQVRAVATASLDIEEMTGRAKMTVSVPAEAAELCRSGWTIVGCVGKTARGWRLVEVWNVYT